MKRLPQKDGILVPVAVVESGNPPAPSSSSGSSSEADAVVATSSRTRALARRSKRRLSQYLQEKLEGSPTGLSLLERRAITRLVEKECVREYQCLQSYLRERGAVGVAEAELDKLLTDYLETLFFAGEHPIRGEKILAPLMRHEPAHSRVGTLRVPRAWRALKGWKRLCPGRSKVPLPRCFWAAAACRLAAHGRVAEAIFVLLSLSSYLRPGQLLSVRKGELVPPAAGATATWSLLVHPVETGTMSKTGDRDVSILLDSSWLQWLGPGYREMKKGAATDRLFQFNYHQFVKAFHVACAELGMEKVVPYQVRHSGATADRGDNRRTLLEVQRCGQWRSVSSVQRYEKAARLATSIHMLGPELLAHAQECELQVSEVILFGKRAPTVPYGVGGLAATCRR